MPETAILAPAAGSGLGKALADRLLAKPGFIELMTETAWGCLHAYSLRYDTTTKVTVESPDFKVRSTMFFGLLAHMEGEPIKRIIHQHLGAGGEQPDFVKALRESPALLTAMKREIEKAEWAQTHASRAQRAEAVTAVEADEVPV